MLILTNILEFQGRPSARANTGQIVPSSSEPRPNPVQGNPPLPGQSRTQNAQTAHPAHVARRALSANQLGPARLADGDLANLPARARIYPPGRLATVITVGIIGVNILFTDHPLSKSLVHATNRDYNLAGRNQNMGNQPENPPPYTPADPARRGIEIWAIPRSIYHLIHLASLQM